jgi:hypothetical protein
MSRLGFPSHIIVKPLLYLFCVLTLNKHYHSAYLYLPLSGVIILQAAKRYITAVKALLTNTDMGFIFCLTMPQEIDTHRTVPTGLAVIFLAITGQKHVLSTEI